MEQQVKPVNNVFHSGFSKKLYVFFICCILSSLTWVLIKLSNEYTEVLDYPVSFINIPSDKILTSDLDTVFTVKLKSKGYRILSNRIFKKRLPIEIDLSDLLENKFGRTHIIPSANLFQTISNQIHYSNIISVFPDTLIFRFEKTCSKRVPIKASITLRFAPQYKLVDSLKFSPDSVIITGPKKSIDTINEIISLPVSLTNLNKNQDVILRFSPIYKKGKVLVSPPSSILHVHVEKYTETTLEVPVEIENKKNELSVRVFPEKIKITYLVPLSKYKDVKADMFSAVAEILDATPLEEQKIKITIRTFPTFVEIKKIEPDKVEYLYIK